MKMRHKHYSDHPHQDTAHVVEAACYEASFMVDGQLEQLQQRQSRLEEIVQVLVNHNPGVLAEIAALAGAELVEETSE